MFQPKHEIEVFVAKKGHTTEWHNDFQENFTLQLQGRKRWWFRRGAIVMPIRGLAPHYAVGDSAATRDQELRQSVQQQSENASYTFPGAAKFKASGADLDDSRGEIDKQKKKLYQDEFERQKLEFDKQKAEEDAMAAQGEDDGLLFCTECEPKQCAEGRSDCAKDVKDDDIYCIDVCAGDVLYFPSGIWHRVESISDERSVAINMSLMGTRWSELLADSMRQLFNQETALRERIQVFAPREYRKGCELLWEKAKEMVLGKECWENLVSVMQKLEKQKKLGQDDCKLDPDLISSLKELKKSFDSSDKNERMNFPGVIGSQSRDVLAIGQDDYRDAPESAQTGQLNRVRMACLDAHRATHVMKVSDWRTMIEVAMQKFSQREKVAKRQKPPTSWEYTRIHKISHAAALFPASDGDVKEDKEACVFNLHLGFGEKTAQEGTARAIGMTRFELAAVDGGALRGPGCAKQRNTVAVFRWLSKQKVGSDFDTHTCLEEVKAANPGCDITQKSVNAIVKVLGDHGFCRPCKKQHGV